MKVTIIWNSGHTEQVCFKTKRLAEIFIEACKEEYNIRGIYVDE